MKKVWLLGAALAAFGMAGTAHAEDHTGLYVAGGGMQFDGDFTFSGGKPAENVSGAMTFIEVGGDYQFGSGPNGFVLGGSYFQTLGDGLDSGPVRDGNYLVQNAHVDGLTGWEVRGGFAFGDVEPYIAYGQTDEDASTFQSCPNDWNSVVAGFCRGGGVPATAIARQGTRRGDAGQTMDTWSIGVNWNLSTHAFVDIRYSQADYGSQIVSLEPTGNTAGQTAHPATDPHQDPTWAAVKIGYRF